MTNDRSFSNEIRILEDRASEMYDIFIGPVFNAMEYNKMEHLSNEAARVAIVAIGVQESALKFRRQKRGGPARGLWQFELPGLIQSMTNGNPELLAWAGYRGFIDPSQPLGVLLESLAFNDIGALILARSLLWSVKEPLPEVGQPWTLWDQYLKWGWRPGKPRRDDWLLAYDVARHVVIGDFAPSNNPEYYDVGV